MTTAAPAMTRRVADSPHRTGRVRRPAAASPGTSERSFAGAPMNAIQADIVTANATGPGAGWLQSVPA
ncbi:MAG TPA: hypothetical protein VFB06_21245 [Streptosporangiaceae bacterium]|nr:hypothetical protein [Streptosporangiaceae bacterium]